MEIISKMSGSWIVDDVSSSDGGDLSTWELIDPSDDETLEFPLSETESPSEDESLSRSPPKKKPPILIQRFGGNYYNPKNGCHVDDQDGCHQDGCHVDGRDDGDEYDESDESDGDGFDDELVPNGVRLERNRMRKLGKREYSKMAKSKKMPLVYNRPGCVRGKHGLGLRHSLM